MSLMTPALQSLIFPQYPRPIADAYLKQLQDDEKKSQPKPKGTSDQAVFDVADLEQENEVSQIDTPDVPMRAAEKKRLYWKGLTCVYFELSMMVLPDSHAQISHLLQLSVTW